MCVYVYVYVCVSVSDCVTGHFVGPSESIDDLIERVGGYFESINTREERVTLLFLGAIQGVRVICRMPGDVPSNGVNSPQPPRQICSRPWRWP